MENNENISGADALEKLKEIIDDAPICHFISNPSQYPLSVRPMSTMKCDEDGCVWFLSDKSSDKNQDIQSDPRVQLLYAHKGGSEFISVSGNAEIVEDKKKLDELWTSFAKAYFPGGKDDPSISLICVKPESGYYWDTKHNKTFALIKMAVAAVTGKATEPGVKGKMNL